MMFEIFFSKSLFAIVLEPVAAFSITGTVLLTGRLTFLLQDEYSIFTNLWGIYTSKLSHRGNVIAQK
jgi:hypothetical protein